MNEDLKSAISAKTGIIFKARREELGLTISEVSNKYMINIKYLRSIESGSYSGFPSEGFARAYFRKYSNILDIKPEFPAVYAVQNRKDEIINKSYKSIKNPIVKILIGLAGLALLILIVIISMLPKSTSKDILVLEPNLSVSENIQVLIPDIFSVDDNNSHDNQNSSLANKITKKNIVELPKIIPGATKNNLTVPALTSPIKKTAQKILNDIHSFSEFLATSNVDCPEQSRITPAFRDNLAKIIHDIETSIDSNISFTSTSGAFGILID